MPTDTQSTAYVDKSTRSGWPYNATFPALERRHCWISDVHTPPRVGRHRAAEPPKVSLAARLRAALAR